MPLEPGTRLGPYEVIAPIDTGSERYKASDTRRHQVVALKVLSSDFSGRPDMKARLEQDVRTISSLNHPQICPIVDVGHQDPSTDFVVAELVEGETLAERLTRGPLELNEALDVAIAIADSLHQAHRLGVVHAGLNPSVVVLSPAGPKVLDFGVSRAARRVEPLVPASMGTTRTALASLSSAPAHAAAYMAPEQFTGGAVDARTDLFSLGSILYEMVTGKPAFSEKTLALLVAAVQTVDPEPVSQTRPMTPPALDYVITRCLSKDPRQRFQTAFDVWSELRWMAQGPQAVATAPAAARSLRDRASWIALAVAAALALWLAPSAASRFRPAPDPPEARFVAASLPGGTAPITLSPDGRWLTATTNGGPVVGLSLDSVTPQTLITGVPYQPFWKPDSRSMAYFEGGKLWRADIGGGPPQIICDTPLPISVGTWNADGIILFPGAGLIQRVLAAGGQPAPITTLDQSRQETEHVAPVFLPDGRHFLFLAVASKPGESAIYVGSLDSSDRTRLFANESRTVYAAPGYLLFNRGDTVFAHAFDADALTLSGEPIRVASGVPMIPSPVSSVSQSHTRWAAFAVSQTGVLAYRTGAPSAAPATAAGEQRSLWLIERNGNRSPLAHPPAAYAGLDLSRDGKRVALHRHEGTGGEVWFFDLAENRMQQVTFDATQDNSSPIWSPDGTRLAFASKRANKWGLYVKPADGSSAEERITESDVPMAPSSWSRDGKLLVYVQGTPGGSGNGDIWAVPMEGDKKPFPLPGLQSEFAEGFAQVSPDGNWLAYQSYETERPEVYVKPFPEAPGKWRVSTDGGLFPRWRGDSGELYFYFNNSIIAAEIRIRGSSVVPEENRVLFRLNNPSADAQDAFYQRFAVSPDGQRFLVSQAGAAGGRAGRGRGLADQIVDLVDQGSAPASTTPNAVTVVLNWTQIVQGK